MTTQELIEKLKVIGVLRTPAIEEGLREFDRADFVPQEVKKIAYQDEALSIGYGQTISQPYTVVFMLERLGVQEGDIVLDIGSGSGWQAALLSHLVGESGKVITVDITPRLYEFSQSNISKYPQYSDHVQFFCMNAKKELPEVPETSNGFDKIIVSSGLKEVPQFWYDKLKTGGIIMYPKDGGVYKEVKVAANEFTKEYFPGFAFVPFIEE